MRWNVSCLTQRARGNLKYFIINYIVQVLRNRQGINLINRRQAIHCYNLFDLYLSNLLTSSGENGHPFLVKQYIFLLNAVIVRKINFNSVVVFICYLRYTKIKNNFSVKYTCKLFCSNHAIQYILST